MGIELGKTSRKKDFFQTMLDKIQHKLAGWKNQHLSQSGRLTLIKSTLSSILNYSLSCFKAPSSICNKIDQIIRSFQWGHNTGEKKIHLRSWDFICLAKSKGGTGIRRTEEINKTLLGKHAWRIISNLDSLVVAFFLPKYLL